MTSFNYGVVSGFLNNLYMPSVFRGGGNGSYLCGVYRIHVSFEETNKKPVTLEGQTGETLLEVVLRNDIELHHNCGGVCACSTCHIYLEQGSEFVEEMSEREEDFVDRARNPRLTSRLACQCELLQGSGELRVIIPDQSVILGE